MPFRIYVRRLLSINLKTFTFFDLNQVVKTRPPTQTRKPSEWAKNRAIIDLSEIERVLKLNIATSTLNWSEIWKLQRHSIMSIMCFIDLQGKPQQALFKKFFSHDALTRIHILVMG